MASTKEYKVGTISDIIAKSCGVDESAYDPKLCAIFNNVNTPKVYRMVEREQPILPPVTVPDAFNISKKEKKKDKAGELSHKDAASIRVKAKTFNRYFDKPSTDSTEPLPMKKEKTGDQSNKDARVKAKSFTRYYEKPSTTEPLPPKKDKKNKKKKLKKKPSTIEEITDSSGVAVMKQENEERMDAEDDDEEKAAEVKKPTVEELNAPKGNLNPELESRTIFVGNVPGDMTQNQLKKLFKHHGVIEAIRFRCAAPPKLNGLKKVAIYKKEFHPDRNSLAAFIRFKTREEAEKAAAETNGVQINKHHLTVDLADNKSRDNKKAIFIGNLHLKIQDDELWTFFEDCGVIQSVRIVRDSSSGLGKGFGYVNFMEVDSVELALKKDGQEVRNRPMRVSRAVKKVKDKNQRFNSGKPNIGGGPRSGKFGKQWNADDRKPFKGKTNNPLPDGQTADTTKMHFAGDRLSEVGKLKRKSNKINRDEVKKSRIAKQLTGTSYVKPTSKEGKTKAKKTFTLPKKSVKQQKKNVKQPKKNVKKQKTKTKKSK